MATEALPSETKDLHILRSGRVADLPEITRLRTSVRENHLSVEAMAAYGITHESVAARMQSGTLASWVVTENDQIVGFAMADKTDGNLFALFTHPEREGMGIGSRLLSRCEAWLFEQGLTEARLETGRKTRAAAFYARRGWVATGGDDEDIRMKKCLTSTDRSNCP